MSGAEDRVRAVVAAVLSTDLAGVPPDATRETLPRWDSLRHVQLVLALEQEFGVEFTDAEIPALRSVAGIAALVASKGA